MRPFVALMYHEIEDNVARSYTVSRSTFERHISYLKSEGFIVEGLNGLEKRLETHQWPERYLIMTFDDGHCSNLLAADILQQAGFNATFFLTKHFSEARSNFLKASDIRILANLCHIGSHSVTHSNMAKLSPQQARAELYDSKQWLEELTDQPITTFSAPNGSIDDKTAQIAFNCGYTLLCNSTEWWNYPAEVSKKKIVNRLAVRQSFTMKTFATVLRQDAPFFIGRMLRSGILSTIRRLRNHNI